MLRCKRPIKINGSLIFFNRISMIRWFIENNNMEQRRWSISDFSGIFGHSRWMKTPQFTATGDMYTGHVYRTCIALAAIFKGRNSLKTKIHQHIKITFFIFKNKLVVCAKNLQNSRDYNNIHLVQNIMVGRKYVKFDKPWDSFQLNAGDILILKIIVVSWFKEVPTFKFLIRSQIDSEIFWTTVYIHVQGKLRVNWCCLCSAV